MIHDAYRRRQSLLSGAGSGFTLVELLIAMAVAGLVMYAVYSIYLAQQKVYTAQLAVTEMQQNMRVAVNLLSYEIRMTGYANDRGVAGILQATPEVFGFSADLNNDGDVDDADEKIHFDQYLSGNGVPVLGRSTTGSTARHQPAAEYVEHLRFHYLDADDRETKDIAKIRTIVVDVVVRASQEDRQFNNTATYMATDGTKFGGGPKNDHFRRRHEVVRIEWRNAGIADTTGDGET
ncbi:MAG: prepilin-type N-terminal cleavage/methylation domain-containing protein [Desulfobulbaceae bacterium]|nr:prepilin-type N-terminal cleavage/methylation domain-containing protein [Desulfobulbaceae bacterium]